MFIRATNKAITIQNIAQVQVLFVGNKFSGGKMSEMVI